MTKVDGVQVAFRLVRRTYAPWGCGVRVVSLTKPRCQETPLIMMSNVSFPCLAFTGTVPAGTTARWRSTTGVWHVKDQ